MIPRRVSFLSDREDAPEIDPDLLGEFRSEIEEAILRDGTDNTETLPLSSGKGTAFLTTIPKPKIGRVMARWVLLTDEEALVTGVRSGEAYEVPPEEDS